MPAKSKAQQKAAGAALSAKRGETNPSELIGASRQMYDSMSEKQLDEFASTKRKGKPDYVPGSAEETRALEGRQKGRRYAGQERQRENREEAAGQESEEAQKLTRIIKGPHRIPVRPFHCQSPMGDR